ncbi:probable E3 ubiquitin-protein ligase MID2 isoform X2 [Pomacea canaliculata]|uniref:probable E3 ubiquitin-protein ligase MID2 isoform X2 n=1 Tax=Pomacea canaliculata TaxID=400727 RepID=UPI000D72EA42|nr:probable E3 ubiquitin-protein ligase MID2 isoform X2 [Pomacea canaliculata]
MRTSVSSYSGHPWRLWQDDFLTRVFVSIEKARTFYRGVTSSNLKEILKMATASKEVNEIKCGACKKDFAVPKILSCGHLICRKCVISCLDPSNDASCPLCRSPIVKVQDQSEKGPADVADALPTEFVMEALVESAHVLAKNRICCACDDITADYICMQCQDMLCSSCYQIHKKLPGTSSHDVESVSTVTPERLAASRPALCADHGDKHADFLCLDHHLVICKVCKCTKHKECFIKDFDDEIESAESSLNDLMKILVQSERKLEQAIGQLSSCLQEVDRSEEKDVSRVDEVCNHLQILVEEFRNKLKEKTRCSHYEVRKSLRYQKVALEKRLEKVTSHKDIVTRARAVAPRPALMHAAKALIDRVNSLDLLDDNVDVVSATPSTSATYCEDVVSQIEEQLDMSEEEGFVSQASAGNSTLWRSNSTRTEHGEEYGLFFSKGGVIASYGHLKPNILYQLRLDEVDNKGRIYYGVTQSHPFIRDLRKDVRLHEWQELYTEGSVAGLMLTSKNNLQFYLNGGVIGTEAVVSTESYVVFKLHSRMKVTILPAVKGIEYK